MSFANTLLYVKTIPPIGSTDKKGAGEVTLDGDNPGTNKHLEELARNED